MKAGDALKTEAAFWSQMIGLLAVFSFFGFWMRVNNFCGLNYTNYWYSL